MANINTEIQDFRNAVHGEDVRGSMISLAEKVNEEASKAQEDAADVVRRANSGEFKGDKGDTGAKGSTGSRGATGATGAQGLKGEPGKDAVVIQAPPGAINMVVDERGHLIMTHNTEGA